jgi:hypothetical protein
MPIAKVGADVLSCAALADSRRASDNQILDGASELLLEGEVELESFVLVSIEEIYGGVQLLRRLVFFGSEAVCEQREGTSFIIEQIELLSPGREVGEEDHLSVCISPDDVDQETELLHAVQSR